MNRTAFALSIIAVVAAAAWTYNVNYRTETALGRVEKLRSNIAAERESVEVLRVEWAYLNAPDRLARLVELHKYRLELEPMAPRHFDEVAVVPFPPRHAALGPEFLLDELDPAAISAVSVPVTRHSSEFPLPVPRPVNWRPD